jgi:tetratricopeptide (TPR) repeat protein
MNRNVEDLFHELADLPAVERERRLRDVPLSTADRADLIDLLRFDSPESYGLTAPVAAAAQGALDLPTAVRCGAYRLLHVLGRGGMGTVWLGERADGEVEQRVAVKLICPSRAEPSFHDRFLRERQILASLSHPGIARLLDAGHTGDGQPYLVMEHIDGSPIDAYAAGLDLPRKVALFLRVCDAVSYAHRNLVLHRDLKPSNILVDQSGQPKLLDFGIARILEPGEHRTRTVDRMLTPEYASPEQIAGRAQGTPTDIYALGAILRNLVAGPAVPRDLAAILDKTLRPEPEDRYGSVDHLADDLRAFLDHRPVRARAGNTWYRARKTLRRYWAPATAGALVVASLAAGLYAANRERAVAQRRFDQLRQLATRVFDFDAAIRNLPGSAEARQRLVTASVEYLEGLAADARSDVDLAQELADAYWRIGRVQGVPTELNLGQFDQAKVSLRKADDLIRTVLRSRPNNASALLRAATIAQDRMILADSERREKDAIGYAEEAAQRLERIPSGHTFAPDDRRLLLATYGNLGLGYLNLRQLDRAELWTRRTVELARRDPHGEAGLAMPLSVLANVLRARGDLTKALESIEEARRLAAVGVYPDAFNADTHRYAVALRAGLILGEDEGVSLDRPAEAAAAFEEAFRLMDDTARRNPRDFASRGRAATAARELADVLRHRDPQRALSVYETGVARLAETGRNLKVRRDSSMLLAGSASALRSLGRPAEARRRLDQALTILRETGDYPSPRIPLESAAYTVLRALGDHQAATGELAAARATYESLLTEPASDLGDANRLSRVYDRLGRLLRRSGNRSGAESIDSRRLALWRAWESKLPANEFVAKQLAAAEGASTAAGGLSRQFLPQPRLGQP